MWPVDKPNQILQRQRAYQASHLPIYLRPPRSKLYFGTFLAGFSVAMVGTSYGVFQLLRGKSS